MPEPRTERGTAGHRRDALAAERGAQLRVHELVEDRVLRLQHQRRRPVAPRSTRSRRASARSKILPLPRRVRLLLRAVVDLLEHPRHGEHERRLELGEVVEQVLHVRRVAERAADVQRPDLDHAAEDVRDRQEQQGGGRLVEEAAEDVGSSVHSAMKLRCSSWQPLGRPVVPEV